MTNFNPENLTAAARNIALTAEEKAASRARLVSYMELTPARAAAPDARMSRFAGFSFLHLSRAAGVFALVGAVTLSGAGVSYAAENALPGDTLYPVKVSVNEEVRAVLTPSAAKKAEWEAERAERRLAETEALAETGRLDDSRRAEMEARYAKHADRAKERMVKLREMKEDGPGRADEVEARLEGAVDAHTKIIAAIADGHPGVGVRAITVPKQEVTVATTPVIADSDDDTDDDSKEDSGRSKTRRNQESDTQDVAKKTELKSEEKVSNDEVRGLTVAANARRNTAVRLVAETRKFLASVSAKLGAEAVAEAEARLKTADILLAEGDALLAAGDTKGAAVKFLGAQRTAQESRLLIKARANLRVKVKLNIREEERDDKNNSGAPQMEKARRTESRDRR